MKPLEMNPTVRVRFAPSPTGALHIGGIRTALYNYLFAKKHGGQFILRIEDTDQNRYVEGAENYIIDALNWCGIPFDEGPGKEGSYGPYRQSERKHIYANYAQKLIESGHAYYAFDLNETLDAHRKDHEKKGKTFIYNWHNRQKLDNSLSLTPEETKAKLDHGTAYVIRFKTPQDKKLLLQDIIRGSIEIDSNVLDDKVLYKSDGMPTYHLANIVDDHLMEITHVIRGEEWLPSLALHQLLYDALEWKSPNFAHLPLIMKPHGKGKLSKRDGEQLGFPVFPLSWGNSNGYREEGYFPEAVINFLALLGWNPGTEQEFFTLNELVENFSLERVQKSGARFDPEKTIWYNHYYMQGKTDEELAVLFKPLLLEHIQQIVPAEFILDSDLLQPSNLQKLVRLIKERASFVHELWDLSNYFFVRPSEYDTKAASKQWRPETPQLMETIISIFKDITVFTAENIKTKLTEWTISNDHSFGKIVPSLRLALVGQLKGPDIFEILELLGKSESIIRIQNAISKL